MPGFLREELHSIIPRLSYLLAGGEKGRQRLFGFRTLVERHQALPTPKPIYRWKGTRETFPTVYRFGGRQ